MWDNRVGKRNPRAPDFKCKDRECGGVIWPPRDAVQAMATAPGATTPPAVAQAEPTAGAMPTCPICGGPMWDDRATKRNPRAPDFKCKNKPRERGGPGCEGVIWPPRDGSPSPYPPPRARPGTGAEPAARPRGGAPAWDSPPPMDDAPPHTDDDLPF
jgi:hypothetical protein